MATQPAPTETPLAQQVAEPMAADDYNYEHFRPTVLAKDVVLTARSKGPEPGDMAPDFELDDAVGRRWRLTELRGRPVVLIFGSGT